MSDRRHGRGRRLAGAALGCAILAAWTSPGGAQTSSGVMPPKRPASLLSAPAQSYPDVTGSTRAIGEAPIVLAAAGDPPDRAVLERANATLNGITTLTADFAQTGGDGRRMSGTLYLQRPGKLRFEYNAPATLEVVSDGSTVLVRDRKLNTADPYPLSQTPLKFLLSTKIDLAREAAFKGIARDGEGVRISIEDSSTLGGTSKITLTFDPELTTLKRWRVVDPQGYTTTVSLSNHERNRPIDPKTFMLNYSRPVN
jgi:outer membrane lipoprotein-sorting protein